MTHGKSFYSGKTQVFWTCKALIDGRTISHQTEIREVRGWRLGAIIHRLKTEFSWPIDVEYRGPECIAFYRLRPGTDPARLSYPRSANGLAEGDS